MPALPDKSLTVHAESAKMSASATKIGAVYRFASVAVLSCIVMTGVMWLYHNRAEVVNWIASFRKDGSAQSGTWFTRWAGVDTTRLKDHGTIGAFGEQKAFVAPGLELDPDWHKAMNKPVEFNWSR
jgi:hypothetical protein